MNRRRTYVTLGVALVVIGALLRDGWFVPLAPRDALPPPPVSGVFLLRLCLFVEGLVLLWAGLRGVRFVASGPAAAALFPSPPHDQHARPTRALGWAFAGVTLLALALRLIAVNSDLWLDEITPLRDYGPASVWQVLISYISSNNHLLNTVLGKAAVAAFGEQEWTVRLPAVLFGTATVPLLFWMAREVAPRHVSVAAALLLATSYHHIFFSQNARGYTGYIFFSLLATGFLVKALRSGRATDWTLYIVAMTFNFATLHLSAFVFAAHVVVVATAIVFLVRRGMVWKPLLAQAAVVFGTTAVLGFHLYAVVIPHMYVSIQAVYSDPSTGFSPFSRELIAELVRGLTAGFSTGLLFGAVPFLALAVAGYMVLWRRNWALAAALTLPLVIQAAALILRGLTLSPRFFILVLPLAMLVAALGLNRAAAACAAWLKRDATGARRMSVGFAAAALVVSLAALPRYYEVPKQAYRASIEYVESKRQPAGMVVVIHLAETGIRYYGRRYGVLEGQDYFYVRTVAALDRVLAEHPGRPSWLIVTLPRALRLGLPDLDARIRRDWVVERRFPGTIGDGDITVWGERAR